MSSRNVPEGDIQKVVIVGGGTAGWMAAAAFSKLLPTLDIVLVESEAIGTVGVGEATIPHILYFNRLLGLAEDDFVCQTNATFKLGIMFDDWGHLGESYFHSFGPYGINMEGIHFHHHWIRHARMQGAGSIDDYNIQVMAANAGKFQRPSGPANSPLSTLTYAFQFDASLYAKFMRGFAEARGVTRTEGRVIDTVLDDTTGNLASIRMESGKVVEGDLFIDCSGFRGMLSTAVGASYDDWSDLLPCNRAVAQACTKVGEPVPFTRATAKSAGWQWRIPLQSRTGNGHVYASDYISDDEAIATLHAGMDGEPVGEPNWLRFTTGIRREPWTKNVVALGLASGFLEPLESTSIHLVQTSIARLMANFPDKSYSPATRGLFNRQTRAEYEQVRDFLVLHYCVTQRDDSAFWNHVRTMPLPDTLQERIDIYSETARVFREDNEIFGETSWFAVMHGQGLEPRAYHPVANTMPTDMLESRMADIRKVWANNLSDMPTHQEFIDANCRA